MYNFSHTTRDHRPYDPSVRKQWFTCQSFAYPSQRWDEQPGWTGATEPPTTPHHKPRRIRSVKGARMVLSLPSHYKACGCTKKCSSIKAMTRWSLTNSNKSKPFGFHFQHGSTTLAQVSIHHSYLAHVLIFLIYSSIFKQHPIAREWWWPCHLSTSTVS